ncbi:hypothetical protein WL98_06365 [Burkholderia multivorans]|nr:hypothetical protein WL98_06365 [Burkholderia multivorans]
MRNVFAESDARVEASMYDVLLHGIDFHFQTYRWIPPSECIQLWPQDESKGDVGGADANRTHRDISGLLDLAHLQRNVFKRRPKRFQQPQTGVRRGDAPRCPVEQANA